MAAEAESRQYDEGDELTGRHLFGRCRRCGVPALLYEEYAGQTTHHGLSVEDWRPAVQLHPPPIRPVPAGLPAEVDASYRDAVRCERQRAWAPTVVMVGRALEAVAQDFGVRENNLYRALEEMKNQGMISEEILDWSHELRGLRNFGAHVVEGERVDENDARDALDFLNAIVGIVYELRRKFQDLRQRRGR